MLHADVKFDQNDLERVLWPDLQPNLEVLVSFEISLDTTTVCEPSLLYSTLLYNVFQQRVDIGHRVTYG